MERETPYEDPVVRDYGDLLSMTQAGEIQGLADAGAEALVARRLEMAVALAGGQPVSNRGVGRASARDEDLVSESGATVALAAHVAPGR